MGVNWQNNDVYQGLKDYEKQCGLSLAERNAIANPYGSHTFGGLLISQVLPQLLIGGAEKLGNSGLCGSGDTGSETDVEGEKNTLSGIGKTLRQFDTALAAGKSEDADKHLGELKKIADDNPDNRRAQQVYEKALEKKKNHQKK